MLLVGRRLWLDASAASAAAGWKRMIDTSFVVEEGLINSDIIDITDLGLSTCILLYL